MEPQRNISFMRFILGLAVLLEMVYCLVFAPLQEFKEVILLEQQTVASVFGPEDTRKIYERADWIYSRIFLKTGLAAQFVGKKVRPNDSFANIRSYSRERAKVMLNYAYLIISRLSHFVTWLPLFVVLLAAGIYDGLCMREIKKTNFDWVSPVRSRYATRMSNAAIMVLFMALMAPLWFTPLVIPICSVIAVIGISLSVRNFQKRI